MQSCTSGKVQRLEPCVQETKLRYLRCMSAGMVQRCRLPGRKFHLIPWSNSPPAEGFTCFPAVFLNLSTGTLAGIVPPQKRDMVVLQ